MHQVRITAVIKAKNEDRNIADCIASLEGFADEIIVVNDSSEDDTVAIAKRLGAKVIDAESRDGVIDALDKIGFEHATGEWLIRLDADERMTPTLAKELRKIAEADEYAGVSYACKNMMFGDWPRYGGWFKSNHPWFFRADAWDRNWSCWPHTPPPLRGRMLTLPAKEEFATIHYAYDDVSEFVRRTLDFYARAEAYVRFEQGILFSPWRLIFKPIKRFLGRYFIRQGWRDGARGLILAGLLAAYDFCIEANLWDLHRRKGK